jgi:hypothetical protein
MKLGIKVDFGPGFSLRGQNGFSKTLGGELVAFTERVMSDVRDIAAKKTPRKTGAASRAWKKQGSKTDTVVENTKPYIQRLDEGYSRQAPGGILKPTLKEIRRKYR